MKSEITALLGAILYRSNSSSMCSIVNGFVKLGCRKGKIGGILNKIVDL